MQRHYRSLLIFAALYAVFPVVSFAQCYTNGTCPPVFWNYEPPGGFAGITQVYILGRYFGDTQGTSTVTIGGAVVAPSEISMWSDGMIIARVPSTAATGPILVTTAYGSDDSATEAANAGWLGTGQIAANFVVFAASNPPVPPPGGAVIGCQYVGGTWLWDDGWGDTEQYTFNQSQTQNSDGTWNVTGTALMSQSDGMGGTWTMQVNGTLDQNGKLQFLATGQDGGIFGEAYKILNSGCDRTSPGYVWYPNDKPVPGQPPPPNFPYNLGNSSYDLPIIKQQTDIPDTETTSFVGWFAPNPANGTGLTAGGWSQTLSSASNAKFGGRLVYEQDAGGGTDTCWFATSKYRPASLTGGSWWVDAINHWETDFVGFDSDTIDYYRSQGRAGCEVNLFQAMYIDSSILGPVRYTTNQLSYPIDGAYACSAKGPQNGPLQSTCTLY